MSIRKITSTVLLSGLCAFSAEFADDAYYLSKGHNKDYVTGLMHGNSSHFNSDEIDELRGWISDQTGLGERSIRQIERIAGNRFTEGMGELATDVRAIQENADLIAVHHYRSIFNGIFSLFFLMLTLFDFRRKVKNSRIEGLKKEYDKLLDQIHQETQKRLQAEQALRDFQGETKN